MTVVAALPWTRMVTRDTGSVSRITITSAATNSFLRVDGTG